MTCSEDDAEFAPKRVKPTRVSTYSAKHTLHFYTKEPELCGRWWLLLFVSRLAQWNCCEGGRGSTDRNRRLNRVFRTFDNAIATGDFGVGGAGGGGEMREEA